MIHWIQNNAFWIRIIIIWHLGFVLLGNFEAFLREVVGNESQIPTRILYNLEILHIHNGKEHPGKLFKFFFTYFNVYFRNLLKEKIGRVGRYPNWDGRSCWFHSKLICHCLFNAPVMMQSNALLFFCTSFRYKIINILI